MRAREINDYYNQLGEGLGKIVPPQVTSVSRKPLSIALEEIEVGKIEAVPLARPRRSSPTSRRGARGAQPTPSRGLTPELPAADAAPQPRHDPLPRCAAGASSSA